MVQRDEVEGSPKSARLSATNELVHKRLEAVYQFIIEWMEGARALSLLDIGTWEGDFVGQFLPLLAEKLVSIDIDGTNLQIAASRPDIQQLVEEGRLLLLQMDALRMGFLPGLFDIVTCVEVLGAGFDGPLEEVGEMLQQAYECLSENGIMFLTVRSQATYDLLSPLTGTFSDKKGVRLSMKYLRRFAEKNELDMEVFGQIIWQAGEYVPLQLTSTFEVVEDGVSKLRFGTGALQPRSVKSGEHPTFQIVILKKKRPGD